MWTAKHKIFHLVLYRKTLPTPGLRDKSGQNWNDNKIDVVANG